MGNLGVPTLPPVTTTWHPSTWWEHHDAPRDEEPPSHLVRPGDVVVLAHTDGSTTRYRADGSGQLHTEHGPRPGEDRAEIVDLPRFPRAS